MESTQGVMGLTKPTAEAGLAGVAGGSSGGGRRSGILMGLPNRSNVESLSGRRSKRERRCRSIEHENIIRTVWRRPFARRLAR
jgi:hypothetical protein